VPSERGLFDRLRDPDRGRGRSVHQRTERVYASVLGHLHRMLNTRQGDSAAAPDYGLPALSDVDLATRAEDVRRAIEQTIHDYEPRLTAVRVRHVPPDEAAPLEIRFEVSARLVTADERVGVRFDTVVDAGGTWKVAG
jgi:type VI secretion system protein